MKYIFVLVNLLKSKSLDKFGAVDNGPAANIVGVNLVVKLMSLTSYCCNFLSLTSIPARLSNLPMDI